CATCPTRFNNKSHARQLANKHKIGISSSWLIYKITRLGVDYRNYKWVCHSCHQSLSQSCLDKQTNHLFYDLSTSEITEDLESNQETNFEEHNEVFKLPEPTTGPVSLDFADIDDKRCTILTGLSKEQFFNLYKSISKSCLSASI
ncbi:unnamed protein product, partial [Brachionus calyciflorus]